MFMAPSRAGHVGAAMDQAGPLRRVELSKAKPADQSGRHDGPVVFVDHKRLFPTAGEVPLDAEPIKLGAAVVARPGTDVTFVTHSSSAFTLLAMTVIDKFGRKTLLIIGSFGMILFLGLTARAFSGNLAGNSHLLLYLIGFIAFFAFSQASVSRCRAM